jgi:phosphatidylserine/phosphatidylglycerophosphate/cardiolipin synthase-like enzyme
VALEVLAQDRALAALRATRVEIVCTAPLDIGIPVRATLPKALEMIESAEHEIVMVGYVFSEGAREILARLAAAQARGVRVTIVANRLREHLCQFVPLWPAGARLPVLYSRDADPNDQMAALHAKLLICDRRTALVTSANFTHHGLRGNIEIGVCVTDQAIGRLADFVSHMIATEEVLLLSVPHDSI